MKLKILLVSGAMAFLASTTAWADYSSTMTSFNPAGYWRLNETTQPPAGDVAANSGSLGLAATGYYLSGATHPVTGAMTGSDAAGFAAGALVRAPYTASLNPLPPFTVEYWLYANNTDALSCPISSTDFGPSPRLGWLMYIDGTSAQIGLGAGALQFRLYHSGGTANASSPAGTIVPGTWNHIVAVAGTNALQVYVNGTSVATANYTGTSTPTLSTPFCFGTRYDAGFPLNGSMDEVAVYGVALTETQVQAHYAAAATGAAAYSTQVLTANPLAYWHLNEPAYVAPDPSALPVAVNLGSVGTVADGKYSVYSQPGATPAPFAGFGAGNYACGMNAADMPTSILLGNPAELNFSGQITMMAWVKPAATDGLRNILSHGHQTSPANAEMSLRINGGLYQMTIWGSASDATAQYAVPAGDIGNWVFLAGIYDGAVWRLYRNGKEVSAVTNIVGAIQVSDTGWAIGARGTGTERFFKGTIDEVAILTNGLSAAQVLQLYNAAQVPPFFTTQPQAPAGTVYEGMTVPMNVLAEGVAPLAYQWLKNGTNLVGKTSTNLTLVNVSTSDSGNYAVVVTNTYGAVTSSIVALSVVAGPPVIFQAPKFITKYVGARPSFSVVAGGSVPITYQWRFGTTDLLGQTNATLTLNPVTLAEAGTYSVAVSNSYGGSVLSATLTLVQPDKYAAAVMANVPRAYWRLNETSGTNALDWAGSYDGNYVGVITNNVPSVQSPTYLGYETTNTGYQFSGARAFVETPALGFTNNTFTIAFWANPVNPQADGVPFMFTGGSSLGGVGVNLDNGTPLRHHYADNGPSGWWQSSGLDVNWDTWNYIVVVIEPSQATFYLDKGDGNGLQSSLVPGTHVPMPFNLPCYISRESRDMRYFKGPMDEVAVFDRSLSASEVRSLHAMAISGPQPPTIVKQPASTTRYVGKTASFSVEAAGVPPLAYQWKTNGVDVAGATSASLTVPNVQLAQNGLSYSVTVTTSAGNTNSDPAVLTVLAPPTGYAGTLFGYGPLAYWQLNETAGSTTAYDYVGGFDGAIQGGLTFGGAGPRTPTFPGFSAGNTAALFDGNSASVLTSPAMGLNTNTVTITCWVKRNGAQIDYAGLVFTRGGQVSGLDMKPNGELRYHWNNVRYDWSSGLIAPDGQWTFVALVVEPTKATMYMDAGTGLLSAVDNVAHANCTFAQVRLGIDPDARWFNGELDEAAIFDRALSPGEIATLDAAGIYGSTTPPFVSLNPAGGTVIAGNTLVLSAGVSGSLPISYQWKKDGVTVPGATTATLTVSNVYFTDAGSYTLWATNGVGYTNTTAAVVTVMPPPSYAMATNDLVLHLKFENNTLDSSGRTNDGTAMGAPTYVSGQVGQALRYNTVVGSTYNYVYLGAPTDLNFSSNINFTVSYWVKFTGTPGDLPFLCTAPNSYGGTGLTFAPGYGTGTWSYYVKGTVLGVGTGYNTQPVNNGAWHHLLHSFDRAGNSVTYLDGVPVYTGSIATVGDLDNFQTWSVGQDPTGLYAETATGDIDDIGIWRRALTSYEAAGVYAAGQSGFSFDVKAPVKVYFNNTGGYLDMSWQAGTLLQCDTVNGTYAPVPGAVAPFHRVTLPTSGSMYYRVSN